MLSFVLFCGRRLGIRSEVSAGGRPRDTARPKRASRKWYTGRMPPGNRPPPSSGSKGRRSRAATSYAERLRRALTQGAYAGRLRRRLRRALQRYLFGMRLLLQERAGFATRDPRAKRPNAGRGSSRRLSFRCSPDSVGSGDGGGGTGARTSVKTSARPSRTATLRPSPRSGLCSTSAASGALLSSGKRTMRAPPPGGTRVKADLRGALPKGPVRIGAKRWAPSSDEKAPALREDSLPIVRRSNATAQLPPWLRARPPTGRSLPQPTGQLTRGRKSLVNCKESCNVNPYGMSTKSWRFRGNLITLRGYWDPPETCLRAQYG